MKQSKVPEGWEEKSLGCIAKRIISGSTPSTSNPDYWDGEIVWVTPDDLSQNDSMYVTNSSRRITPKGLSHSSARLIPRKSIVMSSRAPIGYVAIMGVEYATNQGCKSLELKDAVPEFMYYSLIFNMPKIRQQGEGTTFAEISKTQLEKVTLMFPKSPDEQKKIANVLQTVDETIVKTKEVIRKNQKIKQGLMQSLLSKGIDANGRPHEDLKSSEMGLIPTGWEIVELGDHELFDLKTGGTPSTEVPSYWNKGTVEWLSSGEVHKKKIHQTEKKITESGYRHSNAVFIPPKSTLIALAGQGKTRGTAAITEIRLTTNQSVAAIIPQSSNVDPYFLYHYMDSQYQTLRAASAGAGRAGLSLTILSQFKIKLPKRDEQTRVAEVLEAIDSRIMAEQMYLAKLTNIRTGLMQNLLTGSTRVVA